MEETLLDGFDSNQIINPGLFNSNQSAGFREIIGCLLMMIIAGLSSLAGLGGGGPNVVVMMIFFDILPKDATLIVFACVFGSSFGNIINQMRRSLDGQPVVQYNYAYVVMPIMFVGSLLGVFINKFLPSAATISIIVGVAISSLPKIYNRFRDGYQRQNEQLLEYLERGRESDLIKQTVINPFQNQINIKIFKGLLAFVFIYSFISLIKGTEKFPSILGIKNCSILYWILEICLLLLAWRFYNLNHHNLMVWTAPAITLGEALFEKQDVFQSNKKQMIYGSICAGIFSGFGLGGGIFLVPMFRHFKLSSIQATSTCTFTLVVVSFINTLQSLFLGVLSIKQFLFFFTITSSGSLILSVVISYYLRKANRMSFVELLLLILLTGSIFYLPYGLWLKYKNSGGDLSVIFGFGSFC